MPMVRVAIPDVSNAPRKALIITNHYGATQALKPLATTRTDFHLAVGVLKEHGFTVTRALEENVANLGAIVQTYVDSLVDGDVSLVYFSGYGERVHGANIIYTDDGNLFALDGHYIARLGKKECTHIVVLDSCRPPQCGAGTYTHTHTHTHTIILIFR